jgi:SAM-dependent methyltransferase
VSDGEQQYWRDVATEWLQTSPQSTWRTHSDSVNADLLGRWLPPLRLHCLLKTDAFDEAVSAGLFPQLAAHAETVIAIDISRVTLAAAALKYRGLAVAAADLRRLPFSDGSLDAVASFSTLDHFQTLDELAASLRELRRVLAPGGHLILTLDNLRNPLVALRNGLPFSWVNRLGIVPYRVGRTVGPRRLQALLEEVGFEVEEVGAVLHVPRVIAVALSNLVDRLGSDSIRRCFLRLLLAFEPLSRLPTRFLTGYFIAVRARRPSSGTL